MITGPGSLGVSTPWDREVVVTRAFAAPRQLVFAAHTKPELVRRWLLGPTGWRMPVCDIDLRVGGSYRYAWQGADGASFGMGGVFPSGMAIRGALDRPGSCSDAAHVPRIRRHGPRCPPSMCAQ